MKYFSKGEGAPAASSYASANISGGVILRVGKHFRRRHLTRRQTSHFKGVSYGWGLFPRQGGLFLRKSPPWGWGLFPRLGGLFHRPTTQVRRCVQHIENFVKTADDRGSANEHGMHISDMT
jgi:hypothetical protein